MGHCLNLKLKKQYQFKEALMQDQGGCSSRTNILRSSDLQLNFKTIMHGLKLRYSVLLCENHEKRRSVFAEDSQTNVSLYFLRIGRSKHIKKYITQIKIQTEVEESRNEFKATTSWTIHPSHSSLQHFPLKMSFLLFPGDNTSIFVTKKNIVLGNISSNHNLLFIIIFAVNFWVYCT